MADWQGWLCRVSVERREDNKRVERKADPGAKTKSHQLPLRPGVRAGSASRTIQLG